MERDGEREGGNFDVMSGVESSRRMSLEMRNYKY